MDIEHLLADLKKDGESVAEDVFLLNGQAWQVVDAGPTVVRVRRFRGKANATLFKRHIQAGRYFRLLPPSLKALMRNE